MDFEALARQRQDKAAAAAQPAASPRRRRRAADSKRSTWLMRAWYVQPETARRLLAYVNRQKEAGHAVDASDVVDESIRAWLDQQGA